MTPGEKASVVVNVPDAGVLPVAGGQYEPTPLERNLIPGAFVAVAFDVLLLYGTGPTVLFISVIEQVPAVTVAPLSGMLIFARGEPLSALTLMVQGGVVEIVAAVPSSVQLERPTVLTGILMPPVPVLTLVAGVVPVPVSE